jgi:hypothetical protein
VKIVRIVKKTNESVEHMCKTCVRHCRPNCKMNSIVLQVFRICCAYFVHIRMFFDCFQHFPCFLYMLHICSAYVAHILHISGPRTLFPHVFHNCSAYVPHIFRIVFTIVCIFGTFPATLCPHVFYNSEL